jgi:hypothetical protein
MHIPLKEPPKELLFVCECCMPGGFLHIFKNTRRLSCSLHPSEEGSHAGHVPSLCRLQHACTASILQRACVSVVLGHYHRLPLGICCHPPCHCTSGSGDLYVQQAIVYQHDHSTKCAVYLGVGAMPDPFARRQWMCCGGPAVFRGTLPRIGSRGQRGPVEIT